MEIISLKLKKNTKTVISRTLIAGIMREERKSKVLNILTHYYL